MDMGKIKILGYIGIRILFEITSRGSYKAFIFLGDAVFRIYTNINVAENYERVNLNILRI